jgi:hypothetical protein
MDTAEYNDLGVGAGCLAAQFQRIAAHIGQVLYLRRLVVVGQYDGIVLFGERLDSIYHVIGSAFQG